MSRVHTGQKFVNMPEYHGSVINASTMIRIHANGEDFHYASSLSSWLFIKYNMSYETYRHKSRHRREELRKEYLEDTEALLAVERESSSIY